MTIIFLNSFLQAFYSTLISSCLGLVLAWLYTHTPPYPLKNFLKESMIVFFILPTIPLVLGVLQTSQLMGWSSPYGVFGIVVCHVCINAPFVARTLLKSYENIPAPLWREAYQLKMRASLRFQLLEWPYLKKSFLQGSFLVFCLCLASFSIPFMLTKSLQTTSLSLALYNEMVIEGNLIEAIPYLIPFLFIIIAKTFLKQTPLAAQPVPFIHTHYKKKNRVGMTGLFLILMLFLSLPLILVIKSFLSLKSVELFKDSETRFALFNSFCLAFLSGVTTTILSLISAVFLSGKSQRFASGSSLLFLLPNFVIGICASTLLGNFVDSHSYVATFFLHSLMPLPFTISFLSHRWARIQHQGSRLIQTLRLSPKKSFTLVYGPQLVPSLISIFSLSAAFSLGDVGASAFFGSTLETLPTLILKSLAGFDLEKSLTLSVFLLGSVALFCTPGLGIKLCRSHRFKQ